MPAQNYHHRPAPPYEAYEPEASGNTENTPLVPRQVTLYKTGRHLLVAVLIGFILLNVLFSTSYVSLMESRLSKERSIWEKGFKLRSERLHQQEEHQREREEHQRQREEQQRERGEHQRQREEHQRQQEEHQRQREEQWDQARQRQKLSLHWANRIAESRCHTYNTRYYHAILLTTPPNQAFDVDLCQEISLDIHDRSIYPTRCEADENGIVRGVWKVQFDEPACKPYWNDFHDKGCSAPHSGKRRYEARLENIGFGEDGMKLCYETPTDVDRSHFDKPESCIYKDEYEIYGTWAPSDHDCL